MLTVVDRWFERRTIEPGLTLLWEPHVHPLLRCNIWSLQGRDHDLLIDTGLGVASLWDAARDLWDKPLIALATHAHMDHGGGMHEFDHRWVHAAEAASLAEGRDAFALRLEDYDADERAYFAAAGYDMAAPMMTAIPHEGFDPAAHLFRGAPATRVLQAGDVVDLGDRAFEVLHLPGHSPGSIGLWEAETGALFSGDAIYDGPLLDALPGSNPEAYCMTMERLIDLPVRVVHAGHEPSFDGERLRALARGYLLQASSAAASSVRPPVE